MTAVAIGLCLFVAVLGMTGVVSPPRFLELIRSWTSLQGFYAIAVFRVAFGAALSIAAADSRAPVLLRVFGILLIASALATPFFGHSRYRQLIEWWSAGGPLYVRAWAGGALLLAVLLILALLPIRAMP